MNPCIYLLVYAVTLVLGGPCSATTLQDCEAMIHAISLSTNRSFTHSDSTFDISLLQDCMLQWSGRVSAPLEFVGHGVSFRRSKAWQSVQAVLSSSTQTNNTGLQRKIRLLESVVGGTTLNITSAGASTHVELRASFGASAAVLTEAAARVLLLSHTLLSQLDQLQAPFHLYRSSCNTSLHVGAAHRIEQYRRYVADCQRRPEHCTAYSERQCSEPYDEECLCQHGAWVPPAQFPRLYAAAFTARIGLLGAQRMEWLRQAAQSAQHRPRPTITSYAQGEQCEEIAAWLALPPYVVFEEHCMAIRAFIEAAMTRHDNLGHTRTATYTAKQNDTQIHNTSTASRWLWRLARDGSVLRVHEQGGLEALPAVAVPLLDSLMAFMELGQAGGEAYRWHSGALLAWVPPAVCYDVWLGEGIIVRDTVLTAELTELQRRVMEDALQGFPAPQCRGILEAHIATWFAWTVAETTFKEAVGVVRAEVQAAVEVLRLAERSIRLFVSHWYVAAD